jgi:hypothetical protein
MSFNIVKNITMKKQYNITNILLYQEKVTMLFTQNRMNLKIYQVMKF